MSKRNRNAIFSILLIVVTLSGFLKGALASNCKGCTDLDEHNIGKVVRRFGAALVKFDVAYPFGDKHEEFVKFAEEVSASPDLIIGEVGVKDYGEKTNLNLAKKYGIEGKNDLPKVRLFLGDLDSPVPFEGDYSVENFREFVRDNTELYIGLPGCKEKYDLLAKEFVKADEKTREVKLKEFGGLEVAEDEEEKVSMETYLKFMKKIVETGLGFVEQEAKRLNKIIKDGKVTVKKKEELVRRLNVLHSFKVPRDEL